MIFYSARLKLPEQQPFLAVASKVLRLCKLSFRTVKRKQESYDVFCFIEKSIREGDVVFNIGANEDDYLYIIRRKLGKKGKIIAFETRPYFFRHLAGLKIF